VSSASQTLAEGSSEQAASIDEIAFQTNLLAPNAAVEAAKTTANLIEGTSQKVREGSEHVNRSNAVFSRVAESHLCNPCNPRYPVPQKPNNPCIQ